MPCRPATDDDAPAIRDLRRTWTAEDAGALVDDGGFDVAFAEWWEAESPHRRHWVAEVDGEVVGMASVVVMTRMPRPGRPTRPWGYVHQVYVVPVRRSAGIGADLMEAVIDACRARGFERLVLHPRERSLPFYERLGFAPSTDLLVLELPE